LNNTMIDTGKKMAVDVAIAAGGITGGLTLDQFLGRSVALLSCVLLLIRIWKALRTQKEKDENE